VLSEPDVVRLISQRYVVEVLDALTVRPLTRRQLGELLGVHRPALAVALRALASNGAIRRLDCHGSWDRPDLAATGYELTGTGRALVELLQHDELWDALYQRYLHDQ
jgi:DNA-binding HxlR family transcriptional regulator